LTTHKLPGRVVLLHIDHVVVLDDPVLLAPVLGLLELAEALLRVELARAQVPPGRSACSWTDRGKQTAGFHRRGSRYGRLWRGCSIPRPRIAV
jgi:hypothetical protein